jgi:hypothetical protein
MFAKVSEYNVEIHGQLQLITKESINVNGIYTSTLRHGSTTSTSNFSYSRKKKIGCGSCKLILMAIAD